MLRRSERLNLEQLAALQQKRFARLLRQTIAHSEFYRQYYQEHSVPLGQLDPVRLTDLPIIDKQIMMDHFDQLVCDRELRKADLERFVSDPATAGKKYKGRFEVIHTSGSSGRIGIFVYGANDWTLQRALAFSRISNTQIHWSRKIRYAFIGVIDGHYAGISLNRSGPKSVARFLPVDINWPIRQIVSELNGFMPDGSTSGPGGGQRPGRGHEPANEKRTVSFHTVPNPRLAVGLRLLADRLFQGVDRGLDASFHGHGQVFHFQRDITVITDHMAD